MDPKSIDPEAFISECANQEIDFFTGVPDSVLKGFCHSIPDDKHITAANEGGAIGIAMGYHMGTGKVPLVYMQNSGLGNAVNPLISLAAKGVYEVPMLLVIGWRGKPGKKDEPQHLLQGSATQTFLDAMKIPYRILDENWKSQIEEAVRESKKQNTPFALLVEKGLFAKAASTVSDNQDLSRKHAIECVASISLDNPIIATTGKAGRELFTIREQNNDGHDKDFLCIGGMGHASQIALGLARTQPEKAVYCLDGDGAALMHLGSMAVIGFNAPKNLVHILLNNGMHESVGGHDLGVSDMKWKELAELCGYPSTFRVQTKEELKSALQAPLGPVFIEAIVGGKTRSDLGRPTISPKDAKEIFMKHLTSYSE